MAALGHRGSFPFQSIPKPLSLGDKDQEGFLSEPRACLDSVWQYSESRCQASVGELGFWPSLKLEKRCYCIWSVLWAYRKSPVRAPSGSKKLPFKGFGGKAVPLLPRLDCHAPAFREAGCSHRPLVGGVPGDVLTDWYLSSCYLQTVGKHWSILFLNPSPSSKPTRHICKPPLASPHPTFSCIEYVDSRDVLVHSVRLTFRKL